MLYHKLHLRLTLLASILIAALNTAISQNCTVNANVDQVICANQTLTLNGSNGGLIQAGTVQWSQLSGPSVIITSPASLVTTVTGFSGGNTYVFRLSAKCTDGSTVFDQVSYTVRSITLADAGMPQTLCPGTPAGTMSANALGTGETGVWSGSGSGITITSTSNRLSPLNLTNNSSGTSVFTWTINNTNGCSSSDTVQITNRGGVAPVSAGADILATSVSCYLTTASVTLNGSFGGNGLGGQIGTWTLVSGPNAPTITNPNLRNTTVTNLIQGTYVFRWTVVGPCSSGSDDVTVNIPPSTGTLTSLGGNTTLAYCDNRTTAPLTAAIPLNSGETVRWTQVSGPTVAIIADTTVPSTTVSGLNGLAGSSYVFRYTLTNSFGCTSSVTRTIQFVEPVTSMVISGGNQILPCNATSTTVSYTVSGGNLTQYRILSGPPGAFASYPRAWTNSNSSPATISGLTLEGTYVIQFQRFLNGASVTCSPVLATISITTSRTPTASNAGSNQILACNATSTSLVGNSPLIGTGTWYQLSGPNTATIATPSASSSPISGLINGVYHFRWVIYGGPACATNDATTRVVVTTMPPTTAVAGSNASVCYGTAVQMAANTPASNETGTWSVTPSAGVIATNINSPTSLVTLPNPSTAYTLKWTISNICGSSDSSVILTTLPTPGPVTAAAGPDQCLPAGTTSITLAGNNPSPGTGTWTQLSGPACTITNTTAFNSTVTGMSNGIYTFMWSTSRNACAITRDTVEITISAPVTTAIAGTDQDICSTATVFTANVPTVGTGTWSQISGPAGFTIANPNSSTSAISGLSSGTYVFRWTITNGSCASSQSDVTIRVTMPSMTANAGPNQTICGATTATLAANTPTGGATGIWSFISGPNIPTFSSTSSPTATLTGLIQGTYVLRWNIASGIFCPPSTSDITITVVSVANAGAASNLCLVNTVELSGNAGSSGTWTQFSGPSATITTTGASTAIASGLTGPNTYVFTYTIPAIGSCASTSSNRTITILTSASAANAGTDQSVCRNPNPVTVTLSGNTPPGGSTGTWTKLSGSPSGGDVFLPNANTPGATVSITNPGTYAYAWTIANGSCTNADQVVINVFEPPTPSNAGSAMASICSTATTMSATAVTSGVGLWTQDSGPNTAVIAAPGTNNTSITGLIPGTYVFRWTTSNGTCPSSTSTVSATVHTTPTQANAGSDQTLCNVSSATLSGNVITIGSGKWTQISGPNTATFANDTLNNTTVSGLIPGVYTFRWTSTLNPCATFDDVLLTVSGLPTVANAGNDTMVCISSTFNLYANSPITGNGTWTQISGPNSVTFINPNSPTTQVLGQVAGTYVFQWTIANGNCPSSSDQVTVTFSSLASLAVAGLNQTGSSTCGLTTVTLNATNPLTGTGLWTITSGIGGSFANAGINNTTFSGIGGSTYTLRWTVTNGACSTFDEINVRFNLNPGPASSAPTVCINTPIPTVKHKTTGATGIGIPSGLPPGVNATFSSDTIVISGTPTVAGTHNYSIPTVGGICTSANATGTITVTPDNTTSAASSTPTICINNALTTITHTTTGATGIGTPTGLPTGVSATFSSDTIRISGTPTASGTFNYSIPLTGGCGTVNATGTINVNPENTVTVASSTPIVCTNTSIDNITHITTGATGIGTPTGLPSGVSALFNSDTITISGTPTVSGAFSYVITLTGGCGSVNAVGTIRVKEYTNDVDCRGFFIPEAFSPNGDGINDFFEIVGIQKYPNNELTIVNRWGNKVYETKGYKNDWDGSNQNGLSISDRELPVGTYFYVLDLGAEVPIDDRYKKGYIYLSRKK